MPWTDEPGGGFTAPGVRPWLPMGDPAACNVADQEDDPDSVLSFSRARHRAPARQRRPGRRLLPIAALARGRVGLRPGRVEGTVVVNMSDATQVVDRLAGTITLATGPELEGRPWTEASPSFHGAVSSSGRDERITDTFVDLFERGGSSEIGVHHRAEIGERPVTAPREVVEQQVAAYNGREHRGLRGGYATDAKTSAPTGWSSLPATKRYASITVHCSTAAAI